MANIALDYDQTITEDVEGFMHVINLLRSRNHKIFIVTMRYPSEFIEQTKFFAGIVDGIICTSRKAKQTATLKHGIKIDIWIDDEPRAIHLDACQIWPDVSPEGTIVGVNHQTGETITENTNVNTD